MFTDGKDLFTTDFEGSSKDRIVRSGKEKLAPHYTNDGSKVLYFQTIESGRIYVDLYQANADGSGSPELIKSFDGSANSFPNYESGGDFDPVPSPRHHGWSPDGNKLVFWNDSDRRDLFVWDQRNPNEVQELGLSGLSRAFQSTSLGPDIDSAAGYQGWLAYSAIELGQDDRDLHLVRVAEQADGLLVVQPETLAVRRLETNQSFVVWSPDGTKVAYLNDAGSISGRSLHVVDVSTSTATAAFGSSSELYVANNRISGRPAWSPGGQWIAYSSDSGRAYDLMRIRPDGTDWTKISDTSRKDELFPAWNPIWMETQNLVTAKSVTGDITQGADEQPLAPPPMESTSEGQAQIALQEPLESEQAAEPEMAFEIVVGGEEDDATGVEVTDLALLDLYF